MPTLDDLAKQPEKQKQSRAEKRRAARERKDRQMLTFGEFSFWMDRYTERFLQPLQVQIEWLMLPWYARRWVVLKEAVKAIPGWPARLKDWWIARRNIRRAQREARKAARLARERRQEESDGDQ